MRNNWERVLSPNFWQEILKRFPVIEVVGEPKRILSSLRRGYEELAVRIAA
jgi:hypothetical protein